MSAGEQARQMAEAAMHSDNGQDDQTAIDRRYLELRGRLLDANGLRNIPPPAPLVHDYLYRDTLAWLSGKPGHAKSFVAVELACCVGTGTPWHSHKTEQGRVLYLIAEGAAGLSQRVDAWALNHGQAVQNVIFLPVPVQLMDTNDVAAFGALLAEVQPALVILDTQARVTVSAEENSSRDMGVFVEALEKLRRLTSACVLVVHHEPRNGENLRGSTALEGAASTILRTSKDGDLVTLSNPKQKDAPEMEDMKLALEHRGESAVLVRRGWEHDRLSETARRLLDLLADYYPAGTGATALKDEVGAAHKATVARNLRKLTERRLVGVDESGRWPTYRLSEDEAARRGLTD